LDEDDTLPYCGVRAIQAQQDYTEEDSFDNDPDTIPISYYQRDFPIGSLFSFPIQVTSTFAESDSASNCSEQSMNPVKIHITQGAKLKLKTATLDVVMEHRTLYVSTDENPEYLPFCHFQGESSCSLAGLEIYGPAVLYLGVLSLDDKDKEEDGENPVEMGRVNIFGTIEPVDNETVQRISKAREKAVHCNDGATNIVHHHHSPVMETVEQQNHDNDHDTKVESLLNNCLREPTTLKEDTITMKSMETSISSANQVMNESNKKLSKKERKLLAKQKVKELEDILAKERNQSSSASNKVTPTSTSKKESPKQLSITRERRLDGGIYVRDIILGTGEEVRAGKKVSVTYVGSFPDTGKVFDKNQNKKNPLVFRLGTGEVIKGLERGIEGMRVGGERTITIPPEMGYGKKGMGNAIPGNATLNFEVQLVAVGGK
jgi:FKBP-type peptidyl-prolyl cis-trans isomerase